MEYAEKIGVGAIFERVDKNGKTWRATVTTRTPFFVYVNIKNPYDASDENHYARVQIRKKEATIITKRFNFMLGRECESETRAIIDDYYIIVRKKIRSRDVDLIFNLI